MDEKLCGVFDWGQEPYARVLAWQRELVAARKAGLIPDVLLLGEHTPVITLGRNAQREHLLLPEAELARRGVEVHETDRGGDVTYHGPGQLVGYPILDLNGSKKDVVWYVRTLEEVLIRAAREFGLDAARRTAPAGKRQFCTGVWVGEEKLAAIGVHISRWVTSHGFALNVTTDLRHFDFIVPCGIRGKGVTSLEKQISRLRPARRGGRDSASLDPARDKRDDDSLLAGVRAAVVRQFGEVFGREMRPVAADEWEAWLGALEAPAS